MTDGSTFDDQFVSIPLDKWQWHPSPLPGPVVLITTVDVDGTPDVAPKSWFTVAAFTGPVLGFGCTEEHRTCRNIRATGQFTVNIPGVDLADAIWRMPDADDRFADAGLRTTPGKTITVPAIRECHAHLECQLDQIAEFAEGEVFIFGTVKLVEVKKTALTPADTASRYASLGTPLFFLEDDWYAPLGEPHRVESI